ERNSTGVWSPSRLRVSTSCTPFILGIMRSTIITSNSPARAAPSPSSPSPARTQPWPASVSPRSMASAAWRASSTIRIRMATQAPLSGAILPRRLERQEGGAAVAEHANQHVRAAGLLGDVDGRGHVGGAGHRLAARLDDDVAALQALLAGVGRAVDALN